MDVDEYKKIIKQKIETENLTNNIRKKIQEVKWQKQDAREGFTETFNPLIKSQESVKKSIDEQQNKTLEQLRANQLAITDGLNQNRLAITDGIERLNIQPETSTKGQPETSTKGQPGGDVAEIFDKYINYKERRDILSNYGYDFLPSYFLKVTDNTQIQKILDDVNSSKDDLQKRLINSSDFYTNKEGYILAQAKAKNPRTETKQKINEFNSLSTYSKNLGEVLEYKKFSGTGLFNNTKDIIDRLDLLAASINAGNNGVIPEFSEIVHYLAKTSVITKKQLNTLLKNYVFNR